MVGLARIFRPVRGAAGIAPVRSFEAWADDPASVREANSTATAARLWAEPDPGMLAGTSNNPSLAFRLANVRTGIGRVGARRGPLGVLVATAPARPARRRRRPRWPRRSPLDRPVRRPRPSARWRGPTSPRRRSPPRRRGASSEPARATADGTETSPMPMPVKPPADAEDPFPEMPIMPTAEPEPAPRQPGPASGGDKQPRPPARARPTRRCIRTAAELIGALAQAGGRGGETLRLASDADLEMSSCQLKGMGSWTLRAEPGKSRPRIRFRPRLGEARASGSWLAWLTLLSGSLHVEGIDLILPARRRPADRRLGGVRRRLGDRPEREQLHGDNRGLGGEVRRRRRPSIRRPRLRRRRARGAHDDLTAQGEPLPRRRRPGGRRGRPADRPPGRRRGDCHDQEPAPRRTAVPEACRPSRSRRRSAASSRGRRGASSCSRGRPTTPSCRSRKSWRATPSSRPMARTRR